MRLLTLNAHSLVTPDAGKRLQHFVSGIVDLRPDVIALQEVNQSRDAPILKDCPALCSDVPVRRGNFAARSAQLLREAGLVYDWVWLPVKMGYGCFDEGLALLTRKPMTDASQCCISRSVDYANWKTRRALAVRVEGLPAWFVCTHMGWWNDADEPYCAQWEALRGFADRLGLPVWLMGDFNAPAERRGESYDLIAASGWHDCWLLAGNPGGGATIPGHIDGWHGQDIPPEGLRIDHIWCRPACAIAGASVVFDGRQHPAVSDHYGVLVETESGMGD